MRDYFRKSLFKDFFASIVVFLVALPLCMGISIASGVPVELGIISGIIGGIVVGYFSGCPLQVSGPAAGLAVMVFEYVKLHGLSALVPLGLIVGLVQLLAQYFRVGQYFKATSPALVKGLLSGIGALIFASQFHVIFDSAPKANGITNFLTIPQNFINLFSENSGGMVNASLIGVVSLAAMLLWGAIKTRLTKTVPAPLIAIIVASILAYFFQLDINYVAVKGNILGKLAITEYFANGPNLSIKMIVSAIMIAMVASAETLLCVSAVDNLIKSKSNYNKELFAQGLGNIIAGVVGAIPITGVIVRSGANIESGGKTRVSAILHGVWIITLVAFFPQILNLIPVSSLAAVLILTGWKLMDIKGVIKLYHENKSEFIIYGATIVPIISFDLFTGVIIGFSASLLILLSKLLKFESQLNSESDQSELTLGGHLSFLHLPRVENLLNESEKEKKSVRLNLKADYIDAAILNQINDWKTNAGLKGIRVDLNYF